MEKQNPQKQFFCALLENLILKFTLQVAIRKNPVCLFNESHNLVHKEEEAVTQTCHQLSPPLLAATLGSLLCCFPSFLGHFWFFVLSCLLFHHSVFFSHRSVFLVCACGTSEPPVKEQRDLRRDGVVDHNEWPHLNLEAAELCRCTRSGCTRVCVFHLGSTTAADVPCGTQPTCPAEIPGYFIIVCVKDRQNCCCSCSSSSVKTDTAAISDTCRCRLAEDSGASRQQ